MKTGIKSFIVKNKYLAFAVLCFLVGGVLAMLCLIQKIPLICGVAGVFVITGAMFYYCLKLEKRIITNSFP